MKQSAVGRGRSIFHLIAALTMVTLAACASRASVDSTRSIADPEPIVPVTPLALLHNIKYAFDHDVFFDDVWFDEAHVLRLFGGDAAVFGTTPVYPKNGAVTRTGVCGQGGLCVRGLRFSRFVDGEGRPKARLAADLDPGITRSQLRDVLGVDGVQVMEMPNPHRIYPPCRVEGCNGKLTYVLAPGRRFVAEYGVDATVSTLSFLAEHRASTAGGGP